MKMAFRANDSLTFSEAIGYYCVLASVDKHMTFCLSVFLEEIYCITRPKSNYKFQYRNRVDELLMIFSILTAIRRSGRKVLVHSVRGQGRAAVAIIQYFMQIHLLPMQAAFRVTKLARALKINPGFRETLEFLETQLRNEGKLPASNKNRLAPRLIVQS